MSLLFRMIATDVRADAFDAARSAVNSWLGRKSEGLTMPKPGTDVVLAGTLELRSTAAEDESLALLRQVVVDEQPNGRWTTTVTTLNSGSVAWQWVDLERVSDDPWGPQPLVVAPGVVKELLRAGTLRVGATPLAAELLRVDVARIDGLAAVLLDPLRTTPVVVVSQATHYDTDDVAAALSKSLSGIVPVYLLEYTATAALSSRLGPGLHVYGGAARTFLPGLVPGEALPFRHRVLSAAKLRDGRLAERIIVEPLRQQALALRPPKPYRERGRALARGTGRAADTDALLTEAIEAEIAAEAARAETAEIRDQLEWQALLTEETARELDDARARDRWLEGLLREAGQHVAGQVAQPEALPETVESMAAALQAGRSYLAGVEIGATDETVADLDGYPQAGSWARRTWRALRALDAYTTARAGGYPGDLRMWCADPDNWANAVPVGWLTMAESDTTDQDPAYRQSRVFPVPTDVDPAGKAYMPAHVKIVEGGRPAPRMHFIDDTAGKTSKVHVGYIGPHLPNKKTN